VTVAQIRLDEKGEISSVEILQAPHKSIARATAEAVRNWAFYFDSKKDEKPICISGKLTFYFVLENGHLWSEIQNGLDDCRNSLYWI